MMNLKRLFQNNYQEGNKLLTDKDMSDIERLITLLKQVVNYLINDGSEEVFYSSIEKSLNILINKEKSGFHNVSSYIMSDFRMMGDRGQYGGGIDAITNEICRILKSNALFNKF